MRVLARQASAAAGRAAFFAGLFVAVIALQVGLVTGFAAMGVPGGPGLLLSGAIVLGVVLGAVQLYNGLARRSLAAAEARRIEEGLPQGPCCVVWRGAEEGDIPWVLEGDIRAAYPQTAQRLSIEGYALIDFEVGADGRPKNLHMVDVWPARVFYEAAAEALSTARFKPKPGAAPRFGVSYRMPFVFRIDGASKRFDRARRARRRRWRLPFAPRFTKA